MSQHCRELRGWISPAYCLDQLLLAVIVEQIYPTSRRWATENSM
jgi:hypothetical protein